MKSGGGEGPWDPGATPPREKVYVDTKRMGGEKGG